jgi:DNA invertase Pin-like site-specific DNA recombinase
MATFAYARVSRSDMTTENQRHEIETAGYAIDYWYADEGVSGKMSAMQRPQFTKMLGQMRDGEKLVVTKLDRLGRDAQDVGATIKLLKERNIEVVVLQVGKLDLTSTAGKMMLTMLAAVAEMERDLLIERTHAGLERAKAEGKTLGRKSKTTPEQQQKMQADYKAGATVSALAREYEVSRATVLNIVTPKEAA